jgi:Peptidase A4 family
LVGELGRRGVTTARLVVALLIVAGVLAGGDARGNSLTFAPRVKAIGSPLVSSNWSGYAAVPPTVEEAATPGAPLTFSDVTGSWRQPKARCVKGRTDAAAFWVGIGGFDQASTALEQLGTTAQCNSHGTATYFAWWEIVPAAAVRVSMKVRPGDRLTGAVLVSGPKVTMSLKNLTRHTRFSKTMTLAQPLDVSSVEWIAEAPSSCTESGICQVVPLTNFGSVTFTKAAVTANAVSGTITDPTWLATPVHLITAESAGAVPGALSADGRSFKISWQRQAALPRVAERP